MGTIVTSAAALEGERKHVTVLFADLKQSMELIARRDPEDARHILDAVIRHMMESVHQYGGTVNQVMGDGIMALFGAPLAHEDHALRACHAALSMQEAVKRYAAAVEPRVGASIRIRVGLDSGEVVVRSIPSDLHLDYSAVGETTHRASRMEQMAGPGCVFITAATQRLTHPFMTVRSLGRIPVRGLGEPLEVFELLGPVATPPRFRGGGSALTRFVGRDAELRDLALALEDAHRGRGRLIGVVGDPGIGKSRLVHEFVTAPRAHDALVLAAGAIAHEKTIPYLPIVAVLRAYFGLRGDEAPEAVQAQVARGVPAGDDPAGPLMPPLLELLDAPVNDGAWQELGPPERRHRILGAVRDLLVAESRSRPVLVILEDLQWVDSETLAILESLVQCLPVARLLVLVTYRPEFRHRWASHAFYTQVTVEPLAPERAVMLLDALLGDDASLAPLKPLLIATTDGNPFFLEQSVRTLLETSALRGDTGAYRLTRDVKHLEVAPTVQAVLASRIDRLPPLEKRLLQSASMIGKDVRLALLRAIADVDEATLERALAHLQEAEFICETRRLPEVTYTFKHALTHEVAYGSVLGERRRTVHARIVAAIEQLGRDQLTEHAATLAHHALRGEVWPKALAYLQQAAAQAATRSAHPEALTHLEHALEALNHLPATRGRTEAAVDLRCGLRNSLFALGRHRETLPHLLEAEGLAEGLADRRRLGQVSCHLMMHCFLVGQYEKILVYGERARAAGQELDDVPLQVVANLGRGQAYHAMGQHRRAIEALAESVAPLQGPHLRLRFGMNSPPSVASYTWQAWCCAELGDFGGGLTSARKGLRIAESAKEPWSRAGARFGIGLVHLLQGNFARSRLALSSGLALCHQFGLRTWVPPLASALGHGACEAGDLAIGVPLMEDAVAQASAMGLLVRHSLRLCWLAEGYLALGRLEAAADLARQALQLAVDHGELSYVAWTRRLHGAIAAHRDRVDQAEDYYRAALAQALELEMRPLQARCQYELGSLQARGGRPCDGRHALAESLALFQAMAMGTWEARARTAMASG